MTFEELGQRLQSDLPQIAAEVTEHFGRIVAGNIQPGSYIKPPDHRWGNAGTLYNSSGALSRSFQISAGSQDTIFHVTVSGAVAHVIIGSSLPYAAIQNTGGAIVGTPRMTSFFWAMYYQSKDEFWKGLALHTRKGLPIIIKPTDYLTKAEQLFAEEADRVLAQICDRHINEILA